MVKFTLKLWIDKKANRVLFAEASKDFVDFLFSLLSLPVGSVIKLLTKSKMLGCVGNVYESVQNLNDTYFLQPADKSKDLLSNPKVAAASSSLDVPFLTTNDVLKTCYSCMNNHYQFRSSSSTNTSCPACGHQITALAYVPSKTNVAAISTGENGYVKEVVPYMVTDDLTIMPLSTLSITTLLNKFSVDNVNSLEERVVDLGTEEGLELLRLSLQSKTALSEVFLVKKRRNDFLSIQI